MMEGMTRSTKRDIVSLILLLGWVLPSPIGAICAVISGLLGFFTAQQGSKWWFVVPTAIVALTCGLLYIGFHAAKFPQLPFFASDSELKERIGLSSPIEST